MLLNAKNITEITKILFKFGRDCFLYAKAAFLVKNYIFCVDLSISPRYIYSTAVVIYLAAYTFQGQK